MFKGVPFRLTVFPSTRVLTSPGQLPRRGWDRPSPPPVTPDPVSWPVSSFGSSRAVQTLSASPRKPIVSPRPHTTYGFYRKRRPHVWLNFKHGSTNVNYTIRRLLLSCSQSWRNPFNWDLITSSRPIWSCVRWQRYKVSSVFGLGPVSLYFNWSVFILTTSYETVPVKSYFYLLLEKLLTSRSLDFPRLTGKQSLQHLPCRRSRSPNLRRLNLQGNTNNLSH